MKEKTFYLDTPPIRLNRLSDEDDFQIDFDLKKDDFVGVLNIRLDPDYIEWDNHDGDEFFPRDCNRLIVSVTTELEISEAQFLENTYLLVGEYLKIFFNYLQVELGQYWVDVGSIHDWGLITLLDKTIARQVVVDGEEKIHLPLGGYRRKIDFSPKRRIYPEKSRGLDVRQIPEIKSWFKEHKEPDLASRLLANSKRSLLNSDYKSSSILAITALEQPLEEFIKERCKKRGISKNALDTYDKNHFIGDYLKLLFPLVLEPNELTEWLNEWMESELKLPYVFTGDQIIEWGIELNRARNEAVHKGKEPKFDTLDRGIFAIEAIYEFVRRKN